MHTVCIIEMGLFFLPSKKFCKSPTFSFIYDSTPHQHDLQLLLFEVLHIKEQLKC